MSFGEYAILTTYFTAIMIILSAVFKKLDKIIKILSEHIEKQNKK